MAPWVDIPLAVESGEALSPYASDAELFNLMLVKNPQGSVAPFHVAGIPGLATPSITLGGTGAMRGVCVHNSKIFFVHGTELYTTGGSGATTLIGTVLGTAMCRMVDTGTHVVIVDGTNAYAATTASITTITPPAGTFSDVAYQDGITFYTRASTDEIYASDLDDPTTIDALSFTTADALPGNCVGLISDHREIVVFKPKSLELYYNSGGSGFPLTRSSPGMIERGCYSVGTIAKYDNKVFWLGDDLRVYMMQGHQATVISTPQIDRRIKDASVVASMSAATTRACAYSFDGCGFYELSINCTAGSFPLVVPFQLTLNIDTGLWHVRRNAADANGMHHIGVVHFGNSSLDKRYVVANNGSTGGIYSYSSSTYIDNGVVGSTPRRLQLPVVSNGGSRSFMHEMYVAQEKATASSTITMVWSDDGGVTSSSTRTADGTQARVRFQRLGSFFQRNVVLQWSTNSRVTITGVSARVEVGGA